jgi:hypothetical protein
MAQRVRSSVPGGNVSDDTRIEALAECTASAAQISDLADQLKSARGFHSSNIKKWKGRGVNTEALRRAIRDRLRDPDEVISELHEYTRLRALQNMPTIQQDLAALWNDLQIDDAKAEEIQRQRWHDDGAFAGRNGIARVDNPHEAGSEAYQCWDQGWLHDQERIAKAMGKGEKPVNTARGRKAPGQKKAATPPAPAQKKGRGRPRKAAATQSIEDTPPAGHA